MNAITSTVDDLHDRFLEFIDGRERRLAITAGGGLLALILLFAGGMWWNAQWRPPPSIFDSPVDDVLGYLALDDFSAMSVEERMRYLGEFAVRFQGMAQEESASMAAFLAGLTGPTREQMRQNARTLAKDVLLDGAEGYFAAAAEDRGAYLDDWMAGWQRAAEDMMGRDSGKDDAERAEDIRADARRDMTRERDPGRMPGFDGRDAERFMGFWQSDIEVASTPREQGQIIRFLDDLRVHLAKPPGA